MDPATIRVLFLEDDRGVAEATMRALLADRIEVVGLATTVQDAVTRAGELRPDVIVADIDLVGANALELPGILPDDGPAVLWWSGHDDFYRPAAASAGGAGYVSKRGSLTELIDGIRRVAAGEIIWSRQDIEAGTTVPDPPSGRQREVLRALHAGRVSKEIAIELGIMKGTVDRHIQTMFETYDVHTKWELLEIARKYGWI